LSLPLEISRSGSKSSSNSPELMITWTVGLAVDRTPTNSALHDVKLRRYENKVGLC
jgi:hypothetical protein